VAYQPDANRIIRAVQNEAGWIVTEEPILYEIRESEAAGMVENSLYVSALARGLDEKVILQMADMFAWDIDFARDTKSGDTYRVLYEERWLDGRLVTSGKILAAEYVNKGKSFRAYYFKKDDGSWGYYDAEGKALHKAFLKAPVNFRYVSSGFTMARFHPILKTVIPHDGVDYAADYGVPIIAIGDGVVSKMGWNGGYGNRIEIRHNERYGSQYSHMSAYVKTMEVGDRVKQGETIGYVGSTGYSTGNHVHFSMTEYGKYVDPSLVDAPDGEALDAEFVDVFQVQVRNWSDRLDQLSTEY
jgi:murein DD-endopeptidase MepM/ murein hydrolase activator NlpD